MSKIKKRSGNAVAQYCHYIDYTPDLVFQVGVGLEHPEVEVMAQAWPDVSFQGCDPIEPAIPYLGLFHNVAVGDFSNNKCSFFRKSNHKDGSTAVRPQNEKGYSEQTVRCEKLDNFYPEEKTLLWLDCEGGELGALQSGEAFLKSVQVINVEMTGRAGQGWPSPLSVHKFLRARGFYKAWVHTTRAAGGQYDAIYVRREYFSPHYCSDPAEHERWLNNSITF